MDTSNVVNKVLEMLKEEGEAYLDWGSVSNEYKNCPNRQIADAVGRKFKSQGYPVFYQVMGCGNSRIAQGAPIAVRIFKKDMTIGRRSGLGLFY